MKDEHAQHMEDSHSILENKGGGSVSSAGASLKPLFEDGRAQRRKRRMELEVRERQTTTNSSKQHQHFDQNAPNLFSDSAQSNCC